MDVTTRLREMVERVERLAEQDPGAAKTVREKIRPEIEETARQIESEVAIANDHTALGDCEIAVSLLCDTVIEIPAALERLNRKFERALGIRPKRKALWAHMRQ